MNELEIMQLCEGAEMGAWGDMFASAPPDFSRELGFSTATDGRVLALRCAGRPLFPER